MRLARLFLALALVMCLGTVTWAGGGRTIFKLNDPLGGLNDMDGNGHVTLGDAIYLLNYLFLDGPAPVEATLALDPYQGFAEPFTITIGVSGELEHIRRFLVGDFDSDGDIDIVACDGWPDIGSTYLLLNDGTGLKYVATELVGPGITYMDGVVADFNRDGHLDLILVSYFSDDHVIFINDGSSSPFAAGPTAVFEDAGSASSVAAGDVDLDGDMDVVLGLYGTAGTNLLYLNDSASGAIFGGVVPLAVDDAAGLTDDIRNSASLLLVDFDHDGDLDLLSGGNSDESTRIYLNDRVDNPFDTESFELTGDGIGGSHGAAAGYLNRDGYLDLVIATWLHETGVQYFANDHSAMPFGTAPTPTSTINKGQSGHCLDLVDIDFDGDLDLFLTIADGDSTPGITSGATRVLLNNGTSDPWEGSEWIEITEGHADPDAEKGIMLTLAFADLDGDGDQDLILGGEFEPVRVYLNKSR